MASKALILIIKRGLIFVTCQDHRAYIRIQVEARNTAELDQLMRRFGGMYTQRNGAFRWRVAHAQELQEIMHAIGRIDKLWPIACIVQAYCTAHGADRWEIAFRLKRMIGRSVKFSQICELRIVEDYER